MRRRIPSTAQVASSSAALEPRLGCGGEGSPSSPIRPVAGAVPLIRMASAQAPRATQGSKAHTSSGEILKTAGRLVNRRGRRPAGRASVLRGAKNAPGGQRCPIGRPRPPTRPASSPARRPRGAALESTTPFLHAGRAPVPRHRPVARAEAGQERHHRVGLGVALYPDGLASARRDRYDSCPSGSGVVTNGKEIPMRYAGCTVVVALLLALTPFAAWAGKLHVTCTDGVSAAFDDGSVTCDVDGASDGVCTLAFCRSLDEVRRFCATVVCPADASCLEFELKVKPKPKAPKPSKEFKLKPLKAVLSCLRPT